MVNGMAFLGTNPQWVQGGGNSSQMGFAMAIAASMVVVTMFQQFLLNRLTGYVEQFIRKLINYLDPYVQIKFSEDSDGGPKNYQAYAAIETYLSAYCSSQAPRLKANAVKNINSPVLCIDNGERVSDKFKGINVTWHLSRDKEEGEGSRGFRNNNRSKEKRFYALTFRKTNRKVVVEEYLKYVMEEGKATVERNRQLKLYSNGSAEHGSYWNYMMNFEHPATFQSVAMDEEKKQSIIDDLTEFSNASEYYRRIGKPWKRGYLLFGPPGTGKSTLIAAMANLLSYDVYDLELTAVLSNAALKRLLNRIPSNSILVIEDIDCSSDVTGQREKKVDEDSKKKIIEKVTLSGLLNCIDGLYSADEGGRLIVFTTNRVGNLDPALIRRGRMDMHIKMSFCRFEAFKVLAKNYLCVEKHELFPKIRGMLEEIEITPADVAENLIARKGKSVDDCLKNLVEVLEDKVKEQKSAKEAKEKRETQAAAKENGMAAKENGHIN